MSNHTAISAASSEYTLPSSDIGHGDSQWRDSNKSIDVVEASTEGDDEALRGKEVEEVGMEWESAAA